MGEVQALMPAWAFGAAALVTFIAGFVKGSVGFAMPLIMISGLSLFLEPRLAIAGIILPIVFSNLLQVARFGWDEAKLAITEYWRFILIACVMILFVAQTIKLIPTQGMYLVLGVPVVLLSMLQLVGARFHIAQEYRRPAEWGFGALAGALGGLTGTWGPPTVLYLIALDTPKSRHILVQGVVYSLGAISLLSAHLYSGVLNATTAKFSAAMLIPALLGMQMGFRLGDRLNPAAFRKLTLLVLLLAGVNLVRRGIFG